MWRLLSNTVSEYPGIYKCGVFTCLRLSACLCVMCVFKCFLLCILHDSLRLSLIVIYPLMYVCIDIFMTDRESDDDLFPLLTLFLTCCVASYYWSWRFIMIIIVITTIIIIIIMRSTGQFSGKTLPKIPDEHDSSYKSRWESGSYYSWLTQLPAANTRPHIISHHYPFSLNLIVYISFSFNFFIVRANNIIYTEAVYTHDTVYVCTRPS